MLSATSIYSSFYTSCSTVLGIVRLDLFGSHPPVSRESQFLTIVGNLPFLSPHGSHSQDNSAGANFYSDNTLRIGFADTVPFDDVMWRYHDFLQRAEAAYHALTAPHLVVPATRKRHHHSAVSELHRGRPGRAQSKAGRSTP